MLVQLLVSISIASVIAFLAQRARALTISGLVAATIVGTLALLAGWSWGVLLLVYFGSSSALSRFRAAEKEARTASVVEKGGARDAMQVFANGGAFAVAAALAVALPAHEMRWAALAGGALAASASDTWATEIGMLARGSPRSILTLQPVRAGMSGGITVAGTAAAVVGAAFIALVVAVLGWGGRVGVAALLGGIVGSTLDSLLGALAQARRWCMTCEQLTERSIHDCGTATQRVGGLAWCDNDIVNIACGVLGGLLALTIAG